MRPDGIRPRRDATPGAACGPLCRVDCRVVAIDLAVATPTFLDLTCVSLEALPALGEERFAGDLLRSPGGGAIAAVGAARLGLSAAVASPLGDDPAGAFLRGELANEGVQVLERRARSTPTTVVMPVGDERAMITVDHGYRCTPAEIAALDAKAVAASLDQLDCVPDGVPRTSPSATTTPAPSPAARRPTSPGCAR